MNPVAIICSRIESRRLPGKVFMPLAGRPVLGHILERLKNCGFPVTVAIPPGQTDSYNWVHEQGAGIYVGNAESPLHRMADYVVSTKHDLIVRITHDDPLIDHKTMLELLETMNEEKWIGYGVADVVDGAGVEVIHRDNLLAAAKSRKDSTEFLSYFVKGTALPRPECIRIKARPTVVRPYRLTVDYPADAQLLDIILSKLGPDASLDRICELLDEEPSLAAYNELPELSVYTCAYNTENWIRRSLESILRSIRRLRAEMVIVDDRSTDATPIAIAKIINEQIEPSGIPFKFIIQEKNGGLATASNAAISECRGKYVMRIDADDEMNPNVFEREWPWIKTLLGGNDAIYTGYYGLQEINKHSGVTWRRTATSKNPALNHHVGGTIFKRAFLNELRFRDGLRHWDGIELLRRMRELRTPIAYSQAPIWSYRETPGSMSRTDKEQREIILKEIK